MKKRKSKRKKKVFALLWVTEPLSDHESFYKKSMFGGLAIYYQGKLVLVLMENPGDRKYRNKIYDFDIWNGLLIPTDRTEHASIKSDLKGVLEHPVLGKWLYLPASNLDFESLQEDLISFIQSGDKRFGILPKV